MMPPDDPARPPATQPSASPAPVIEGAPDFRLRIDAHALVQLGEQLITDDEQALLELAKNSYDADADYAKIRINTDYIPSADDPAPKEAVGLIEIEDNGAGMDQKALKDGWLLISVSFKRAQKAERKPTDRGRFPLGDKGLGRLGTMKLGKCLSVETRNSPNQPGWQVTFQWSDIKSGTPLDTVPITWRRIPANGLTGTTVRIFGLHNRAAWKLSKRVERVRSRLSGLLSPFPTAHAFEVTLKIDGQDIQFERINSRLRETATVTIDYDWDGTRLKLDAKMKLLWFRKKRVEEFNAFVLADQGAALFEALRALPGMRTPGFGLARLIDGAWYLSASTEVGATDLFKAADETGATDPGPFSGSLDYFDLDTDIKLPQDFLGRTKEYKDLIKDLAQIYVYRDGFGIRMPNDWLELGHEWTTGSGFYSLKPSNVIGFFKISVEHNGGLVEKSDREGFTQTPAWRGFKLLADHVIAKFANKLLNDLGKGSATFLKKKSGAHPDEDDDTIQYGEMLSRMEHVLASASDFKKQIETNASARQSALRRVEGAARLVFLDRKLSEEMRRKADDLVRTIEATQKDLAQDQAATAAFAAKVVEQKGLAASIRKRIEDFEERLQVLYDMVAIGLSAQAMAHDAPALLRNANDHADSLLKLSGSRDLTGEAVAQTTQLMQESLAGLRHMMEFVQPMLRGKRLTKRRALASKFVSDFFEQRGPRLYTRGITWLPEVEPGGDFEILFNPGRFVQIMDNLTTNSEYWIEHLFGAGSKQGVITVKVDEPNIIFSDNGPGVRPDLEDSMFQMFSSGKPKGEGTGLGLFITQQLLLRDSCSIMLDHDTNRNGRRYRFVLNFSGVKATSK